MISGPIQTFPPGLLGFLQLKNSGQNPTDLPSNLQPVLELRNWMFLAQAESVFGLSSAVAPHTSWQTIGSNFSVPQGEAWWVDWLSASALLNAGAGMGDLRLGWRAQNLVGIGTNVHIVSPVQVAQVNPGTLNANSERPFFMPPGADMMYFTGLVGGTADISFTTRITRLKL